MSRVGGIVAASAAVTAAAIGAGLYFAWQGGYLPAALIKPPARAPLPQNFIAALEADPAAMRTLPPTCIRVNPQVMRSVDRMGRPGLAYQAVPGWGVITIAQVPGERRQGAGDEAGLLGLLVQSDLYSVTDTEVDDPAGGTLPARTYSLTRAGWAAMSDSHCFTVGATRITEVVEFARIMPDQEGKRVYEVKVRYGPTQVAPWVEEARAQGFLSETESKKLSEPATATFRLRRTDLGWDAELPANDAPNLTKEDAASLVAKASSGKTVQACIALPAKRTPPGFDVTFAPYAATLFDIVDPQNASPSAVASFLAWQGRFAQLLKAGIGGESKVDANPTLNKSTGTRFALGADYQPWLDPDDASCLRMGEGALDFVALSVLAEPKREGIERNVRASAKFILQLGKDAWINQSTLSLPEVDAVKAAGGVPVEAQLVWRERAGTVGWQVASLRVPPNEPVPVPVSPARLAAFVALSPKAPAAMAAQSAGAPATTAAQSAGPAAATGDVTWRFSGERTTSGRVSNGGLTVTYCCAGASSATLASRGAASGKVYAEFAFTARSGALSGDTWTTIGVVPDARTDSINPRPGAPTLWPNRNEEIKHDDVIGIAVDLDAGQLYFSRNGKWINGQPGEGGGVPLVRGTSYAVVAVLSASSNAGGTDSWTANFGKTRFRHELPRGFKSYDGRQG